ncbi:hypothetical protein ONZ45_g680 [Pleurotus djamor]|nr:hypothetical protein ONZ45_g680 [Pleurotus djamor]
MANRGTSFQLPDIPSVIRDFELHTSPYCRSVSDASEEWFRQTHLANSRLSKEEFEVEDGKLRGIKAGLLAALCFPNYDAPQLRLLTDFLTVVVWINMRMIKATDAVECGWDRASEPLVGDHQSWEVLSANRYFAPLVSQINQLATRGTPEWSRKFTESVFAYRQAHLLLDIEELDTPPEDLDELLRVRIDASGLRMVFNLNELVKEVNFPSETPLIELHERNTMKIIIWALEMVSYSPCLSATNKWNAVYHIKRYKGISLPAALKVCMARLKDHVESFRTTERAILNSLYSDLIMSVPAPPPTTRPTHHASRSSIWDWSPFSRSRTPPIPQELPMKPELPPLDADEWDDDLKEEVRSYVNGMRDCAVGYLNWMYETEVYFGKLGEEVRATGWTFLPTS